MNNVEMEEKKKFPKEIAIALAVVGVLVSLAPVAIIQNEAAVLPVIFGLLMNFVLIPSIFLLFGGIQKLRDKQFNLWNAYYLGLFVAIVLAVQKLAA
ncbi:hypothetical protein Q2E61_11560 [Microbulbifer thermotolerans]|uniref:hypothetical protein n=1 Tax=Microbulbifer thermotolerans TaxID=252514 RepID=UPI001113ED96|nr:hypothetical protein [Microbulbifer thermotolerans]MCX2794700.1 hypothetical protein [Microbulbifer thermotolerans]WKT59531.1 hypothetical protein Q2E61_11560 [Microbulbifer thermotolerans]